MGIRHGESVYSEEMVELNGVMVTYVHVLNTTEPCASARQNTVLCYASLGAIIRKWKFR